MEVLNPKLYHELLRFYGPPRISCPGERMIIRTRRAEGKEWDEIVDAGEYYVICCPICHETRFRLYINHRWNTLDKDGKPFGRHLIHCFNEKCDMSQFEDSMKSYIVGKPKVQTPFNSTLSSSDPFHEAKFPGDSVPLASLPVSHPAVQFILYNRKFDPKELTEKWGVHFCRDSEHYLERGRLILPVFWEGRLVGYQARSIDGSEPKYYTMKGLNKSRMLFNGDQARRYKFGVVVEGPFDVYRVGPQAVALLGKSMSFWQRELSMAWWGEGALCVALDPDAILDMERTTELLRQTAFKWGAFSLPLLQDPGKMSSEEVWSLITSYARARGIPLVKTPV